MTPISRDIQFERWIHAISTIKLHCCAVQCRRAKGFVHHNHWISKFKSHKMPLHSLCVYAAAHAHFYVSITFTAKGKWIEILHFGQSCRSNRPQHSRKQKKKQKMLDSENKSDCFVVYYNCAHRGDNRGILVFSWWLRGEKETTDGRNKNTSQLHSAIDDQSVEQLYTFIFLQFNFLSRSTKQFLNWKHFVQA